MQEVVSLNLISSTYMILIIRQTVRFFLFIPTPKPPLINKRNVDEDYLGTILIVV